jgi:glycosyltransferase involved in cell wall biosynthesis
VAVALLGRLVPEKGVREYLDAADALTRRGFAGQFFVAGAGPLADEVRRRASGHIRALEVLSHPHGVAELMRALDVIACPSLSTPTWEDQGPRIVVEAMMTGCVPVATPTGALSEMLDGHGVITASTSAEDISVGIASAAVLAADDQLRVALADWAHESYSGRAVGELLVELWSTAASRPAARYAEVAA